MYYKKGGEAHGIRHYSLMCRQLSGFVEISRCPLTVLSNAAAILWENMSEINWAGFYLAKESRLVLGPFQGKPACCVIPSGSGVCGTAMKIGKIQLVPNVHQFPGHIACDSSSMSEIVLPLFNDDILVGVLDIDSPVLSRFSQADAEGLAQFCRVIMTADWDKGLL